MDHPNPPPPFDTVLLDMGGVLLEMGNSQGLPSGPLDFRGREALLALLARAGARLGHEDLDRLLFAPWHARYGERSALGREARWEPHLKRLRKACGARQRNLTLLGAWFRPYGEQIEPVPGARPAVAALAAMGLRLAVVSNTPLPGRLYEAVLARHGLLAAFGVRLFSYDAGTRKPSPALLRRALERLGSEPRRAVMVGDRMAIDVAAGRAAGTPTVWVESSHREGPQADRTIRSIADLPRLMGTWDGGRRRVR